MAFEIIHGGGVQQSHRPEEAVGLLVFLAAVGMVYFLAGIFLARRMGLGKKKIRNRTEMFVYLLAVLGLGCMLYGYFVEPYWPQVRRVTLHTPKWSARRPLRVVLLSDMHSDPKVRLEERLPAIVAGLHPDLILFAGDSVNTPLALDLFRSCMTALAHVAPTFAVQGNWDTFIWPGLRRFDGTGVRELSAQAAKVEIAGKPVYVIGVSADREAEADQAFSSVPENSLTIFLHHYPYPDILSAEHRAHVDLYAAGHVHGGQVALPFYGAILTFSRFGKQFESGLYHVGTMPLYVSRGIGMEGGWIPRVRFCSRPEITVIKFVGVESDQPNAGGLR